MILAILLRDVVQYPLLSTLSSLNHFESPWSSPGTYVLFVSADLAYLLPPSDPALFSGPSSVHAGQGQQHSTGRFVGSQGTRSDYCQLDTIP